MKEMKIHSAVGVNVGRIRNNNEDNFYYNGVYLNSANREMPALYASICTDELQIYAVCDGMGGEDSGEEASFIAASTLEKYRAMFYDTKIHDVDKYVQMYMLEASNLIYQKGCELGNKRTGTTIAMILVDDDRLHIYNIGDSRVYRLRGSKLTQLSEDHTPAYRAYKMGMIGKDEIKTHPHRNKLTQYLGISSAEMIVNPCASVHDAIDGDIYLICTDGISDMISGETIKDILKRDVDVKEKVSMLLGAALENGGRDNMTAMVLQIENETDIFTRIKSVFTA